MAMIEHETKNGSLNPEFRPDYGLDAETLSSIEQQMIADARTVSPDSVVVAWVDPAHDYSNFFRTKEAEKFPEVVETDPYYEFNQVYFAIVDTRGSGSVAHTATMTFYDEDPTQATPIDDPEAMMPSTGFYTVDSLIHRGNFTKDQFKSYYAERGIDLSTSVSIETNLKINDNMPLYMDFMGSADLVYLAMLQWGLRQDWDHDSIAVFATINQKQIDSFKRLGIRVEPLMGRTDFRTEEEELGKYSIPVVVDFKSIYEVFASVDLAEKDLPVIEYRPVEVADTDTQAKSTTVRD